MLKEKIPIFYLLRKKQNWGFPGRLVVKNPPATAGDMGSIPDPERSHMPQGNLA